LRERRLDLIKRFSVGNPRSAFLPFLLSFPKGICFQHRIKQESF
jgi:hypothetical protein